MFKFWNGKGVPSQGEYYLDSQVLMESGEFGEALCYCVGEDSSSYFVFEVIYTLDKGEVEEFSYDTYINIPVEHFTVANNNHIKEWHNTLDKITYN